MGKAIGSKTLYPPTFVIHTNEKILPNRFYIVAQCRELGTVLPVAPK
jgi:hypothetical protein